MITSEHELRALCHRALKTGRVALDTEFFWERTFYPQLGIVQLGLSDSDLHLIDAVALPTLPGLGDVLADPGTQLILHDAIQDLQILSRHTGSLPRNVFDTRRAAGFAGMLSTVSLSNLLKDALQIHLAKAETRSNWLQRPLSDEQLAYAFDDIRHLPALCDTLCAAAAERGNGEALAEEMRMYDTPSLYADAAPDAVYLRYKPFRWSPRQRTLLYALVCWREEDARRMDRPRNHIMQDADLLALVQHAPIDSASLETVRGLSRNTLQRHRQAILAAVETANQFPPEALPDSPEKEDRLSTEQKQAIQNRQLSIKAKTDAAGIDSALVATKADITALVRHETEGGPPPPDRLRTGWRSRFLAPS
jgi:ribonuclease D